MGVCVSTPIIKSITDGDLSTFISLTKDGIENPEVILYQAIRYSKPDIVDYIVSNPVYPKGLFSRCFYKMIKESGVSSFLLALEYYSFSVPYSGDLTGSSGKYYIDWYANIELYSDEIITVGERLLGLFIDEYLRQVTRSKELAEHREKSVDILEKDSTNTLFPCLKSVKYLQPEYFDKIFKYIEILLEQGFKPYQRKHSLSQFSSAVLYNDPKLLELFKRHGITGRFEDFNVFYSNRRKLTKKLLDHNVPIESDDKTKNILTINKYRKTSFIEFLLDECDITQSMVDVHFADTEEDEIVFFDDYMPFLKRGFVIPGTLHRMFQSRNTYDKIEILDEIIKFVDINEYYKGYTCMLVAAKFDEDEVIEHLLNLSPEAYKTLFAKTESGRNIFDVAVDIIPDDPLTSVDTGTDVYRLPEDAVQLILMKEDEEYRQHYLDRRDNLFKLALSYGVSPFECQNKARLKKITEDYALPLRYFALRCVRMNQVNIDRLPGSFKRVEI